MYIYEYTYWSTKVNIEKNQWMATTRRFWGILVTFATNVTWGEQINIPK